MRSARKAVFSGVLASATAVLTALTLAAPDAGARASAKTTKPNFSLSFTEDARTVTAGGTADYAVTMNTNRTFRGAVVFELPNISQYLNARIVPQGRNQVGLHINIPPNVPANSGVFVLRGRSGTMVREALFRLTVNAPPTTTPPTTTPPLPTPVTPPQFGVIADQTSRTALPGATVQYGMSVDRRSGFNGPVTFEVQNLPAGAKANFAPNPTTASTVLYVTPGATTPSGTYLITAVATSGPTAKAAATQLVVRRTGDFGLAVAPASITTGTGNDAIVAINVSPPRGITTAPDVDFSVQGLPAGMSAIFTPNPSNGLAQLRLTTSGTAAGTYNATLVGTSGSVRHTVPLRLTVQANVPAFGLQAQPVSQTAAPGAVATYTVGINRANGFTSPIALSVRGLPPQATPTIQVNGDVLTVRVATTAQTPSGTYTLEFTGTSGALQATVKAELTVKA